ncbi:hypothetical protein L195_g059757 [Trifolium pratense]|uniref:Uncharacterized protein n=1 Tax=Trifolium pratense TaxID=57577 RepID=A0A2K3JZT5_TRIPR|nr:hypothetical protein L195_g059757 [Trifolium pratense]
MASFLNNLFGSPDKKYNIELDETFNNDPLARGRGHWLGITVANSPWLRFRQIWIWKIRAKLKLALMHSLLEFMMAIKATPLPSILEIISSGKY